MNIIERIDGRLIEVPYQWLIDKSQRGKSWWIQQSAFLLIVSSLMTGVTRDKWFVASMCIIAAVGFLVFSFSDHLLDVVAQELRTLRLMIMVLTLVALPINVVTMFDDLLVVFSSISDVAMTSFYYFAACKPPAPPKRKEEHEPAFQPSP